MCTRVLVYFRQSVCVRVYVYVHIVCVFMRVCVWCSARFFFVCDYDLFIPTVCGKESVRAKEREGHLLQQVHIGIVRLKFGDFEVFVDQTNQARSI